MTYTAAYLVAYAALCNSQGPNRAATSNADLELQPYGLATSNADLELQPCGLATSNADLEL